jgi:hypothetical protein
MISAIKVIGGTAHPELARDICKHLASSWPASPASARRGWR